MKESISGVKSGWQPATSGIFQRLVLGPVLLNVFINYLCDKTKCTSSRCVDDSKLRGVVCALEGRAPTQRDLDRLEKGKALGSSVKANAGSCISDRTTSCDKMSSTPTR